MSKEKVQWIVSIFIIAAAISITGFLYFIRPLPNKTVPKLLPHTVEVVEVKKESTPLLIHAFGNVQPHRKVTLQPEVSGRVLEVSANLDTGGIVNEGEMLAVIDPRNYETVVKQAKAAVVKAEFELKLEQGKKIIAEREWELLDTSQKTSSIGKELALREPHLKDKEASLQAAKSNLQKAFLDLKRTRLEAPFNAIVTEEFVEIGQVVSPTTKVATLVSTDLFRIQVSVPYEDLEWLTFPNKEGEIGSLVDVIQDIGEEEKIQRKGFVLRLLGDLDPNGRMARILVVVKDPLHLKEERPFHYPLLLDSYVEVRMQGPVLKDIFILPRSSLRENSTVWVATKENTLEIKKVHVVNKDAQAAVVKGELEEGDKVIISQLPVAIPGMHLQVSN